MPATLTYPGVYIQEIPSSVHAITGVATSVTAFLGRAASGPDNTPVTVNSYGDFERIFGGLWAPSSLGYAVRDFFLNGGGQAVIVRLFNADTGNPNSKIKVGTFTFAAASKGAWGSNLRASIDTNTSPDVAKRYGLQPTDLFNLTIQALDASGAAVRTETFRNLTVKDSPARVDKTLAAQSTLVGLG